MENPHRKVSMGKYQFLQCQWRINSVYFKQVMLYELFSEPRIFVLNIRTFTLPCRIPSSSNLAHPSFYPSQVLYLPTPRTLILSSQSNIPQPHLYPHPIPFIHHPPTSSPSSFYPPSPSATLLSTVHPIVPSVGLIDERLRHNRFISPPPALHQ